MKVSGSLGTRTYGLKKARRGCPRLLRAANSNVLDTPSHNAGRQIPSPGWGDRNRCERAISQIAALIVFATSITLALSATITFFNPMWAKFVCGFESSLSMVFRL